MGSWGVAIVSGAFEAGSWGFVVSGVLGVSCGVGVSGAGALASAGEGVLSFDAGASLALSSWWWRLLLLSLWRRLLMW